MALKRHSAKTVLLTIVISTTVFGETPSADNEQVRYHVWTPEPELTTAIACMDNEYGGERPDDPNRQRPVPLPAAVRTAICDLTSRTFAEALYEGPTEYAALFGSVYRLKIPDNPTLHLYVYELKERPELSFRCYSIVLLLHRVGTDAVSPVAAVAKTDYQHYCPPPWIRFQDVVGDEAMEILLMTGHHYGTEADEARLHVVRIGEGLNLQEVLTLRTAIFMPYEFPGDTREERRGFAVRTIKKLGPGRIHVTVSLSRDKLDAGEWILGSETWETVGNSRMHRTAGNKVIERDHSYVFRE